MGCGRRLGGAGVSEENGEPDGDVEPAEGLDPPQGDLTTTESVLTAEATPRFERAARRADAWRGFFFAAPTYLYMLIFFVAPLGIVTMYSFATRNRTGGTDLEGWNLASYARLDEPIVRTIVFRSLWLAVVTTVICLLIAYPFAYFMATRTPRVRNLMLVFVMIPFWTNFLVRNYAWRVILENDGIWNDTAEATQTDTVVDWLLDLPHWMQWAIPDWIENLPSPLFSEVGIVLGLVYGFLPFMILPLYASIERIDLSLVEASRDLYASGRQTLRRVLIPLSKPGIVAGSILVFVPSLGAYVTPQILGGDKETLLGSYIVVQFLTARNWPFGAALSVVLLGIMLIATQIYFRNEGRTL